MNILYKNKIMAEIPESCMAPFCTPDGASVIETKEVENNAKKDLLNLRAEMNSFNWFSFEYLNVPPKNIESFKKVVEKILSEYKKSGFSYEKGNIFYVGKDILSDIAPNILRKDDIKLNIDGRMDPVWITQELCQTLITKNKELVNKKQVEDLCNFLNTLIKVQ